MNLCRTCVVRMETEAGHNLSGKFAEYLPLMSLQMLSRGIFSNVLPVENLSAPDNYIRMWQHLPITPNAIFCLNELPRTNDKSNGYFRRFLIVPFKVQIPKSEVDRNWLRRLFLQSYPELWNWVLEVENWLITQSGFTESSLCQKQLEEYRYGSGVRKESKPDSTDGFKL